MKEFAIFVLSSFYKLCEMCSSRASPVMFTVSQITIVTTLNYPHKMVSSLVSSSAKFFYLWGHVSWQDKNVTPASTVMKAVYLRSNLSNPKCSDPVLAVQFSFLCTACVSGITGPSAWSRLPFGFGVLGHQNVPMLHTVKRQPLAHRIHWTFARKPPIKCRRGVFALYVLS